MIVPLAWVFVLARLNCASVASVEAVRPVSAPPAKLQRADEPLVLASALNEAVPVAVSPAIVRFP